jgi:hypothetical protein
MVYFFPIGCFRNEWFTKPISLPNRGDRILLTRLAISFQNSIEHNNEDSRKTKERGAVRSLNGHTQVNATEIRNLPLPDFSVIKKIGEIVSKATDLPTNLDEIIGSQLRIDATIINRLEERYNGKNR